MAKRNRKKKPSGGKQHGNRPGDKIAEYLAAVNAPLNETVDKRKRVKGILLASMGDHALVQARKREKYNQILMLRLKGEEPEIQDAVLSRVDEKSNGGKRIFGEGVHTRVSDLGRGPELPWDGSLERELRWSVALARHNVDKLNRSLAAMRRYEVQLMWGEYIEAKATLNAIVGEHGQSVWAIEADILLEECSKGIEANKRLAKERGGKVASQLAAALVDCTSQKCELSLGEVSYDHEFHRFIAPLKDWDTDYQFTSYFAFHLNRYSRFPFTERHLAFALHHDCSFSFLDQYLSLAGVLQLGTLLKLSTRAGTWIANAIVELRRMINDTKLIGASWLHSPGQTSLAAENNPAVINVVEAYTRGRYAAARDGAIELLKAGQSIDIAYEILGFSEMYGGLDIADIANEGTLSSLIATLVRSVIGRSKTAVVDASRLRRLSHVLSCCPSGPQLHALAIQIAGKGSLTERQFAAVHSSLPTPRMGLAIGDPVKRSMYLKGLEESWGQTRTLDLYVSLQDTQKPSNSTIEALPSHRLLKYKAFIAEANEDTTSAIKHLEELRNIADSNRYLLSFVAEKLTWLYTKVNRVDDATALVVDLFLHDANLLINVPISTLVAHYTARGWRAQPVSLAVMIFYHATNNDTSPRKRRSVLFSLYQTYLNEQGVLRPSELTVPDDAKERVRFAFFLQNICVHDIMDSSYLAFASSKEVDAERIKVCQALIRIDEANEKIYTLQIASIVTAQTVQQMINKIGQAKIYVDEEALVRSLGVDYKDKFDRFCRVRGLGKDLRSLLQVMRKQSDRNVHVVVIDDIAPTLFLELFNEIKTRFVSSSEYGLDTYLSARIRHGTLAGEIRSQFGKLRLVTKKPTARDDVYEPNASWYPLYDSRGAHNVNALDRCFQSFSKSIDTIIDTCNNRLFQIKNDIDKKDGMFDYSFSTDELIDAYNGFGQATDYEDFLDKCLDYLWKRTADILQSIQKRIRGEVSTEISEAINTLEVGILDTSPQLIGSDLTANIAASRTKMQLQLDSVANWFRITESPDIADFKLDAAVATATVIIANSYPQHPLEVSTSFDTVGECPGWQLYPYIDILTILLHNIIKHGDPHDPRVNLHCRYRSGSLTLTLKNALPHLRDLTVVRQQTAEAKANFNMRHTDPLVKIENKSGYPKLARTLWNDLKVSSCSVDLAVEDDYTLTVTLTAAWPLPSNDCNPD